MASATRSLEEYLDLAYAIALTRAEDGQWVATVDELPGCEGRGATPEEAASALQIAMGEWISDALDAGKSVPTPRPELSGKLLVRMPKTLHADLARIAAREQVSLNQFITGVLSSAVAWRIEPRGDTPASVAAPAAPAPAAEAPQPSRLLRYALVADVVLVAVVAVVALVILLTS